MTALREQGVMVMYYLLVVLHRSTTGEVNKREGISMLVVLSLVPLIPSPGNQPAAPFGEMLGFALAFIGAFVAHLVIWRSYPGGTWWSPPDVWPQARGALPDSSYGPVAS